MKYSKFFRKYFKAITIRLCIGHIIVILEEETAVLSPFLCNITQAHENIIIII